MTDSNKQNTPSTESQGIGNDGKVFSRKQRKFLFICLSIIVLSSIIAALIQTSFGRVDVMSIKVPTQNGQWVVADLFKPKSATAENPAPLVVVVPGFQRSKEALSNIAIELSRRGIVVMSIDPYAQGSSSSSLSRRSATTEGYGMFALVDYAYATPNLNYIDKNRIAATGHSAGGNAAIRGAAYFGKEATQTGKPSKLQSVYVSGYVLTLKDSVLKHVRSNVGISYAYYDEGAYRNERRNGDMRIAPEALRAVNSGLILAGEAPVKELELGRYYGNAADRNLRVVFNERILHPFQPYINEATANQLDYFEKVFDWKSSIKSTNQVWAWKELLSMVSMVASMVMLIPLAGFILANVPYFSGLIKTAPAARPWPRGKGLAIFWAILIVSALIACFSYIPMANLSKVLFPDASKRIMTWFFPQRMNNGVMLWAVLNGSIGFIFFFLSYWFIGRKNGVKPSMWGVEIRLRELWRTFLLAICVFLGYYMVLFAIYYFFHVDYRFLFMGVRPFQKEQVILLMMYAPFFFIFFLSNSLRTNGSLRLEGQKEWWSMLLAGIANSLGLTLIVLVQYVTFAFTGTVYWTDGWLYVNLLFGVVPMMFVLPYFNRYFFKLTGRIYLGPMITCLVFIMVLLSNTVCYLPL